MAQTTLRTRRGFTLVDVAGLIAACGVLGVTLLAMSCQSGASKGAGTGGTTLDSRAASRALKCATQVRGIGQGLVIWAQNNREIYPLPSNFDLTNDMVGESGRAKDTSANIMSLMIFAGMFPSELCVCPDEHSKNIGAYWTYEYSSPKSAKNPSMAIWDPGFRADFTSGKGNLSYSHLQTSGDFEDSGEKDKNGKPFMRGTGRLAMWSNTFQTNEAVLADRAPEIAGVTFSNPKDPSTAIVKTKRSDSITLKNHGAPDSWEGNIAYNDNHVNLETTLRPPTPPGLPHTYKDKSGAQHFDVYQFDEPDDADQSNTFLGIFVKAGKKPAEFKSIWD